MRWPFSRRERAALAAWDRWVRDQPTLRVLGKHDTAAIAFRAGFHMGVSRAQREDAPLPAIGVEEAVRRMIFDGESALDAYGQKPQESSAGGQP